MLRLIKPGDSPALTALTAETDFFRPHEVEQLGRVFNEYHAYVRDEEGHLCYALEDAGAVLGFVYFGPAPLTLGTWQLWWIVVAKEAQGRGLGTEMLRFAEEEIRKREGRVLFIDTSSQPKYEPTRRFYLKHGYEQHAILKEFYAPGDDLVIFRKEL